MMSRSKLPTTRRKRPMTPSCTRTRASVLWISIFFLAQVAFASLSVNLKPPQFLRNLLQPNNDAPLREEDATTALSANKNKPATDLLRLDLSGKMETLLVGPSKQAYESSAVPMPLFVRNGPVAVSLGSYFDFAQRWYGASRVFGRIRLEAQQETSKLLPSVDFTAEQSLTAAASPDEEENKATRSMPTRRERSGKVVFSWKDSKAACDEEYRSNLMASLGFSNHGQKMLGMSVPLHRRLRWECRLSSQNDPTHSPPGKDATTPDTRSGANQDPWWVPVISVNAMGSMQSENRLSWRDATVKLRLRRNVASWGGVSGGDDATTRLLIQVGQRSTASTVQLDAVLENLGETARLTVVQEYTRARP